MAVASDREFCIAVRRAIKVLLAAMDGKPGAAPLNVAAVDCSLQIVAAIERYTGAQIGLSRVLKPLLLDAATDSEADSLRDAFAAVVTAIEKRHNLAAKE